MYTDYSDVTWNTQEWDMNDGWGAPLQYIKDSRSDHTDRNVQYRKMSIYEESVNLMNRIK